MLAERSDRLIPDDEKVRRADYAYVNDGSLAELERSSPACSRSSAVKAGRLLLVAAVAS